jgi:protein phosphatase
MGTELRVDTATVPAQPGDLLLLCSDGLTDQLTDEALAASVSEVSEPDRLVERLARAAIDAGGGDDLSVVAAGIG